MRKSMMKNKIMTLGFIAFAFVAVMGCSWFEDVPVEPPSGIIATPLGNRRIHVTWNKAAMGGRTFDGYELYWRPEIDSADTRREGVTGNNRAMITSLEFTPSSSVTGTAVGDRIFIYMRTQYTVSSTNQNGGTTTTIKYSRFSDPVEVILK